MSLTPCKSKAVECLSCGWIGNISIIFHVGRSWCGNCGRGGLRLLRNGNRKPVNLDGDVINPRTGEVAPSPRPEDRA